MTDCLAQTITNNPQSETVHKHCAALHSSKQTDVYLRPSTRGKDCSLFSPWTRLTVCLRPCWGSASTRRSQTPSWDPATSRHTTVIHTESWLRPITGRDRWCLCGSSSLRRLSRSSQGRPVQRRGGGATADSLICKSHTHFLNSGCLPTRPRLQIIADLRAFYCLCPQTPICVSQHAHCMFSLHYSSLTKPSELPCSLLPT